MAKGTSKKPKVQRKSRRGWAEGQRETVLQPFLAKFTQAISGSKPQAAADEVLREVYSAYFFHFPWDKPDDWEPETLEEYDPNIVLEPENLSPEEQQRKSAVIKDKKSAIRRWLRHRAAKIRQLASDVRADRLTDPFAVLLAKLSGINRPKKARQAFQEWQCSDRSSDPRPVEDGLAPKSNSAYIEKAVLQRWKDDPASTTTPHIPGAFRQSVARDLFAMLPESTRLSYKKDAEDNAKQRRAHWDELMKSKVWDDPVSRDAACANLNYFATPILAGIEQATGCMAVLNVVGPMGCCNGDISAITIAHNVNLEAQPKTLFQWQPRRMDAWREHLRQWGYTYFSAGDIERAKLPPGVQSAFGSDSSPTEASSSTDAAIMEMLAAEVVQMPSKDIDRDDLDSDIDESALDNLLVMDRVTPAAGTTKAPAMPARSAPSASQTQGEQPSRPPSPAHAGQKRRRRADSPPHSATEPPTNRQKTATPQTVRPKPKQAKRTPAVVPDISDDEMETPIAPATRRGRRIVGDDDDDEDNGGAMDHTAAFTEPAPASGGEKNKDSTPANTFPAQNGDVEMRDTPPVEQTSTPSPETTQSDSPPVKDAAVPPEDDVPPAPQVPQRANDNEAPADNANNVPAETQTTVTPTSISAAGDGSTTSTEPVPSPPPPPIVHRTPTPSPSFPPSSSTVEQTATRTSAEPMPSSEPPSDPATRISGTPAPVPHSPPPKTPTPSPPSTAQQEPQPPASNSVASPHASSSSSNENGQAGKGTSSGVDLSLPITTLMRKNITKEMLTEAVVALCRQRDAKTALTIPPHWLKGPYDVMKTEPWGPAWDAVIANWVLYEGKDDFKKSSATPLPIPPLTPEEKKLPKQQRLAIDRRPQTLEAWVKNARPPLVQDSTRPPHSEANSRPKPKGKGGSSEKRSTPLPLSDADFVRFTNLWQGWWDYMQPEWRVRDGTGWSRKGAWKKDWGGLLKYGHNGWMSVVCTLWWWRRALDGRPASTDGEFASWREAVLDVLYVLEGLRSYAASLD